jgi:hypothetical protein
MMAYFPHKWVKAAPDSCNRTRVRSDEQESGVQAKVEKFDKLSDIKDAQ